MDSEVICMNIRIEGQVQNVGYRDFAVKEANHRGLKGWVRNRADGTVEMLAAGLRTEVEAFIAACISGHKPAKVTAFNLKPEAAVPTNIGFIRRPTL